MITYELRIRTFTSLVLSLSVWNRAPAAATSFEPAPVADGEPGDRAVVGDIVPTALELWNVNGTRVVEGDWVLVGEGTEPVGEDVTEKRSNTPLVSIDCSPEESPKARIRCGCTVSNSAQAFSLSVT